MKSNPVFSALFLILLIGSANAWPVAVYTDAQLAAQAEIIAVGHIKRGSIKVTKYPSDYVSNATLLVTTFLKGETTSHELPIILAYGILPVPIRLKDRTAGVDDILKEFPRALNEEGPVLLFEDNPSEGCTEISSDVYQDQIWLLRKGRISVAEVPSEMPGAFRDLFVSGLGVWGPQDVQVLAKENKFKDLLK